MKTIKYIVIGILLSISGITSAQVSVNLNVGSAPQWGPVGYTEARYYYIPDVESYYDIEKSMFIYYGNGAWVRSSRLPSRYRNYDLYNGYKYVMVDYRGNEPYMYHKEYKVKYAKGYKGESQKTIGVKPGKGNISGSNNAKGGNNGGGKGKKK